MHRRDKIRVEAKLQNGAAFGLARQLCIDDLVRPCAKVAGSVHPPQYVRSPAPTFCPEGALDYDVRTSPHRIDRLRDGSLVRAYAIDKGDRMSRLPQMFDVTLLMACSAFPEDFQQWVPDFGLLEDTVGDSEVEACQVAAVEMPTKSDALSCIASPILCII